MGKQIMAATVAKIGKVFKPFLSSVVVIITTIEVTAKVAKLLLVARMV